MNTIEEKVVELKNLLEKQGVSWNDPEDEGAQQILFEHEKLLRQALQEVYTQGKLDALGEVEEYAKNDEITNRVFNEDGMVQLDLLLSHIASLKEPLINI